MGILAQTRCDQIPHIARCTQDQIGRILQENLQQQASDAVLLLNIARQDHLGASDHNTIRSRKDPGCVPTSYKLELVLHLQDEEKPPRFL